MEAYSLPVNLLRQWCFCPRVVYYRELLGVKSFEPIWSKQGSLYHKKETELFKRRNLSRFKLSEGTKHHNINLKDEALRLHGICDLIVETSDNVFAIEYKMGKKISTGTHHAVNRLLSIGRKHFGKKASHSFILTGDGKVKLVAIDNQNRRQLKHVTNEIIKMLNNSCKPFSNATIHQCGQCEYLNYCNDREI